MNETLYRKKGRKYVPAFHSQDSWSYDRDLMPVNTFRLTYAYPDGGRRYEYEVKPDTAGFVAAAMLAGKAMGDALHEASRMNYAVSNHYTTKQQKAVKQAREILEAAGLLSSCYWQSKTADEIARAGIEAVRNFGATT